MSWSSAAVSRATEMRNDEGIEGKTAVVSGSGNLALYCIEKLVELGAKVVTASDSGGFIYDLLAGQARPHGIS